MIKKYAIYNGMCVDVMVPEWAEWIAKDENHQIWVHVGKPIKKNCYLGVREFVSDRMYFVRNHRFKSDPAPLLETPWDKSLRRLYKVEE
jgi:hypothetical protein